MSMTSCGSALQDNFNPKVPPARRSGGVCGVLVGPGPPPGEGTRRGALLVALVLWGLVVGEVCGEDTRSVAVELGGDVNLTCLADLDDVHWYLDLDQDGRMKGKILRTFRKESSSAEFFIYMPETKYSTRRGNVLVLHNITAQDLRVHHCAESRNQTMLFRREFRLVAGATPTAPTGQSGSPWQQSGSVLIGSLALNAFLMLIVAAGGVLVWRCRLKKSLSNDLSPRLPQSPEGPEYEEIVLMAPEPNCVYSQAQMPVCC